jgi:DNA modification methylase
MAFECFRCGAWPCVCKDGQTIIHGDCLEVLPLLEPVDLVLTDPPYGIGEANGKPKQRSKLAFAKDYLDDRWDRHTCENGVTLAMLKSRWQIIFGGNYYNVEPSSCWLVWDKDNGANDYADCELAWTNMQKAVRRFKYRWAGMLQEHSGDRKESRFHPTQKPLPLMKWCITQAPDDVATVLDPFLGSGTTLRACKDLGRRGIGIEIEERYCEIAANRLRQEVLPFGELTTVTSGAEG